METVPTDLEPKAKVLHTCGVNGSKLYLSTVILLTLATADLLFTLVWLGLGHYEGNPLFARVWQAGLLPFVLLKLAMLIVPVSVIEWARKRVPDSAEQGTWLATGAYVALFAAHFVTSLPAHSRPL